VVEAAALAGVFQQDQLERRLGDGEVGVAGPDLGGVLAENLIRPGGRSYSGSAAAGSAGCSPKVLSAAG
jgi:hypothetical protein